MGETSMKKTRNFGDVIRAELEADSELAKEVREAACHGEIARQVYRLRQEAGLSQKELAALIDTHQSVISRIEDDDYEGHSLALLLRIAFACGKELKVSFVDPPIHPAAQLTEDIRIEWHSVAPWHINLELALQHPSPFSNGRSLIAFPV
jgi:transcriptional regulator with XRE-family HTH domain